MRTRWLALAASLWAGAYLVTGLVVAHREGNPPAWWYAGLVVAGALPLVAAAAGWAVRPALVGSAVLLAGASLLGALSIGLLLVPAAVAAAVLAGRPARSFAP